MKFFLGTHVASWLRTSPVPLFISHRRLVGYKTLPVAQCAWSCDSGGFTELVKYHEWRTTPGEYVAAVRRYRDEVGMLEWAAPQDWMCEAEQLARTGKTVAEHQRLTIENYLTLRDLAPELPFIPVLQGWALEDYLGHAAAYDRAGVDLDQVQVVGLGSVCRREATSDIHRLIAALSSDLGLRLHGFGVKTAGLKLYGDMLTSADSMAWSYGARRQDIKLAACTHRGRCGNCQRWALQWRDRALAEVGAADVQLTLGVS